MLSLDRIPAGTEVVVVATQGCPTSRSTLAARGIVPGARLEVLRAGDPMLVCIDDARWAIRRSELEAITVIPINAPAAAHA